MKERRHKKSDRIYVVSNLFPSKRYPGYGTYVENFCKNLDMLNMPYKVIALHRHSDRKMILIFDYLYYYLRIVLRLLFTRYDSVYVHYPTHSVIPLSFVRLFLKKRLYVNLHGGDLLPTTGIQRFFREPVTKLTKACYKLIVPSPYFAGKVLEVYPELRDRIRIYPSGGVDNTVFYPVEHHPIKRPYRVGFVGRVTAGKGWQLLLDAFRLLNRDPRFADSELCIFGDGDETEKLQHAVRHIEGNVRYCGSVEHSTLAEHYRDMDLFCLPTLFDESLGLSVIEAMSCGVIPLVSDCGSFREFIEEGDSGFFLPPHFTAADIRDRMREILTMPADEQARVSRNCVANAQPYRTDLIAPILAEILEDEI